MEINVQIKIDASVCYWNNLNSILDTVWWSSAQAAIP